MQSNTRFDESKLTSLESRFLGKLRTRYDYLASQLHRDSKGCYKGTKYRVDFVLDLINHPRYMGVCIEMQGGIFQLEKTGHSTGTKLVRDYDKCILAQTNGYFFLPVAPTNAALDNACDLLDKLYQETQELI